MTDVKLRLEQIIAEGARNRLFPACSIGYIVPGDKAVVAGGTYTYQNRAPIKETSVFDVASLTKSIPTACLALKLIEERRLGLGDDISGLIDYKGAGDKITVWNLLTHTVYYDFGFRLASISHKRPAEILQAILNVPAKTSKSEVTYTNSSSILLGLIVEKLYGLSLAQAADEVFFKPLNMRRTGFAPLSFAGRREIVPTEHSDGRGLVHGEVHDESANGLLPRPTGTAGLFTTAPDLLKFLEMLIGLGSLAGRRFFEPETVRLMGRNQLAGGESGALGWELDQPRYMGKFSKGTFGKTGFTGCLVLCNLELGAGLAILTNHIHPVRPDGFGPINAFRRDVADLVFGSV